MSNNDYTPDEYLCPITKEIMTDPVVAADGQTYQRQSILEWFSRGNRRSPLSGTILSDIKVFDNITLKKIIREYQNKVPLDRINPGATSDIKTKENDEVIQSLLRTIDKMNSNNDSSYLDINSSQRNYLYESDLANKNSSLLNYKTKREEDNLNLYSFDDQFYSNNFNIAKKTSNSQNNNYQKNTTCHDDDPTRKSNLKNNKFLENKTRKDFESYLNETLKFICEHRGLPQYGNKEELVTRIMEYKKDLKREDTKLRNLIEKRKLEDMLNDDLDDLLLFRGLKYGTNKSEKIKTLKDYIKNL